MPARPATVPAEAARALLLRGLGLLADPARRASPAAALRVIGGLGYVQVDTIQVAERAHHHILASRLDGYRPRMLEKLLERDRSCFEHWTHDAAVIPSALLAHWEHRFAWMRRRLAQHRGHYARVLGGEPRAVMDAVLERLHAEGPLCSRDLEAAPPGRERHSWWGRRKPQQAALDLLWRTGEVAIARRENFQKVYDLFERVLPRPDPAATPDDAALVRWVVAETLERVGVATPGELARYFALAPVAAVRAGCRDAAARGEVVPVLAADAAGGPPRPAFAHPDWRRRAARAPAAPERMRLLNPFDPALHDRDRLLRVFGFDYRFEGFVPAARRRYGAYVMPLLEGDRLVGRLDPKLERGAERLVVKGLWWEPGVRATRRRRRALDDALARFAAQVGARDVHFAVAPR